MISSSSELQKLMETTRPFEFFVDITLADSTVINLTEDDLLATGCRITCSAGGSALPLGAAFCRMLNLEIENSNDRFYEYSFMGASIEVRAEVQLSETRETINLGTYTVTEPETYGVTLSIVGYDDFYKADKPYTTGKVFPISLMEMYTDACIACGLLPQAAAFTNSDYTVLSVPQNMTFRQVIGEIAAYAGGNAVVKDGSVYIVPYDRAGLAVLGVIDGGIFDDGTPHYSSGTNVNGGVFNPWDTGTAADGGTFADIKNSHIWTDYIKLTTSTENVRITGIQITPQDSQATPVICGTQGYVLDITNALAEGKEQETVNRIGGVLIGMEYRPFEMEIPSYPFAEFGDCCVIDKSGKALVSFVTDIDFAFRGTTKIKCSSDSPIRNSVKGQSKSQTYQQLAKLVNNEASARAAAEAELERKITEESGMHASVQILPDQSQIFYLHDQPELANSTYVWKMTQEAIAVSADGMHTWSFGVTVNGTVIAQIMSTIGIDFDWGTGGTLTLGGQNDVNGKLTVLDASGTEIGHWDNNGINITKGTISLGSNGEFVVTTAGAVTAKNIDAQGGKIGGFTLASDALTFGTPSVPKIASDDDTTNIYIGEYGVSTNGTYTTATSSARSCKAALKNGRMLVWDNNRYCGMVGAGYENVSAVRITGDDNESFCQVSGGAVYICADYVGFDAAYNTQAPYKTCYIRHPYIQLTGELYVKNNDAVIDKDLYVHGDCHVLGAKPRLYTTESYGQRHLYCYETPSPLFGDVGEGVIGEDGRCYVSIEPVFAETVNLNQYQVFLQRYGQGECYVSERYADHFIVCGEPGLAFGWELKAKQADLAQIRLDKFEETVKTKNTVDYVLAAQKHINDIGKERAIV